MSVWILTPPQRSSAPGTAMLHVPLPPASEAAASSQRSQIPTALPGKGQGQGGQAREGGTWQGWGHAGGQAEPSHPLPAQWQPGEDVCLSVRLSVCSPRAIVPSSCTVAQPAHTPDVPAVKQNKQTTITALGFPRFDSLRFNFGNLALSCNGFAGGTKPAPGSARPAASRAQGLSFTPVFEKSGQLIFAEDHKTCSKSYSQVKYPAKSFGGEGNVGAGGFLPCTVGLRTWDGVSWISRVHSPAARSPQQWTVMNSQPLNPSLEWSNTLQWQCHALRSVTSNVLFNRKKQIGN